MDNGMFSEDAAAYFANPFRMQDAINQANLNALLKQKEAEAAQQRLEGMLLGGMEGPAPGLTQSQIDFLTQEALTPGARDARMSKISDIIGYLTPYGQLSFLSSLFTQNPAPVVNMSIFDTSAAGEGMSSTDANAGAVNVDGVAVGYGGGYG